MSSLSITIKPGTTGKRILVELDADKLERMAANFGFFGEDFLESVRRAERNYQAGHFRKIKFLKSLRKK